MTEAVVIKKGYTEGGRGIGSGTTARHKRMENALRAIAADLLGGRNAEILSADAVDLATALTLVNEIKAALNAVSSTVAAPLLPAGGAGTYDLSGAGELVLTVVVDGVTLVHTFQAAEIAVLTAATAAELAASINSRGDFISAGVVAQDNAGTLELIGNLGGAASLQGVAGGANATLAFSTTAVPGTGFVAKLTAVEG
jgi:hypothetical protein